MSIELPSGQRLDVATLRQDVERLWAAGADASRDEGRELFGQLRAALSAGVVRAASPDAASPTGWVVNAWVKQGILLGFRFGDIVDASMDHGRWPFFDKDTLPLQRFALGSGVRIVPGGTSVRDGAYLAPGVIAIPPTFVNIGAYVGEGSMIDSHALVGSCAQIGARVHLSASAQIGGVIEPVGALPVIVEDEVLVGGNTGIYEGAVIKTRAVIGNLVGWDRVSDTTLYGLAGISISGQNPSVDSTKVVTLPYVGPVTGTGDLSVTIQKVGLYQITATTDPVGVPKRNK